MNNLKKAEEYLKSLIEQGEDFISLDIENLKPIPNYEAMPKKKIKVSAVTQIQKQVNKPKTEVQNAVLNVALGNTVDTNWKNASTLDDLNRCIKDCQECPLGATRTNFVFGEGNPNADILIIGEAPGEKEDKHGRPFIGRAGQLLTKILESIEIKREDVFIANICKCRPPANRRPVSSEVATCKPYLMKQIDIINPQFIISLGLTSIDSLLGKKHRMGEIRGQVMEYNGRQLMVTYHPAALLRNPNWKRPVWEDMKKLKGLYQDWLSTK